MHGIYGVQGVGGVDVDGWEYRDGLRTSAGKMKWLKEVGSWRTPAGREDTVDNDGELVGVHLKGKPPWGFTLRGGREHREPLVITKVEEGSQAASVSLQVGDEMVSINAVPLSGSRQEAICLVKQSPNTLALVVRRKNEFVSRPHSWHSSKLTEEEAESAQNESSPAAVWQPKNEARPSAGELPSQGDQSNLRQLSNQFSSVNDMERLERPSYPYHPARLSPTKYASNPESFSGGVTKRESGFSCFSGNPSPPVPDSVPSTGKGTSTENIFFKGPSSEEPWQDERPRYLQPPVGNGGNWDGLRADEHGGWRFSSSGRPNVCPVWHVPERKKSQSPPPPPPPLRSDSFAATKVFPYSDGPGSHAKAQVRGLDRLGEAGNQGNHKSQHVASHNTPTHQDKEPEARRSFNPPTRKDLLHPSTAANFNPNQLHPNKLFSLSSNDVRQNQPSFTHLPNHQRQYSDESPFYMQTKSVPAAKPQSVGSYYRSLQDLPTNAFRHSTASLAGSGAENGGNGKYPCVATKQPVQPGERQARQGKAEGCKGDRDVPRWASSSLSSLVSNKQSVYSLPQSQTPFTDGKERSAHSRLGNGLLREHPEDSQRRGERHSKDVERDSPSCQHSKDQGVISRKHQDPWVPQEDRRISPQKTPLLHSLTQESRTLTEKQQPAANANANTAGGGALDTGDSAVTGSGKLGRRGDRYATALRNEIQLKRAQLQKSRSAATLTCGEEEEEEEEWQEAEAWRSTETSATSSDGSFSNTYKDHLKEAQARVLQATSFQRRDLEPLGTEAPAGKPGGQLFRIRGRKRFSLNKRLHSFSEPDKIDKVGVDSEPQTGSFVDRRKFFEVKPAFSRPLPKQSHLNMGTDHTEAGGRTHGRAVPRELQDSQPSSGSDRLSPGRGQGVLEQQRLGTFAEYQATWSLQRKPPEAKAQGMYHSAENILDTDTKEEAVCVHERSRSSPSADFYAQNIPVPWRDPGGTPHVQLKHDEPSSGLPRGQSEGRLRYPSSPLDQNPQPAQRVPKGDAQEGRDGPLPGFSDHRPKPEPASASSHPVVSVGPGCQHPVQPPQSKGPLPAQRAHLGPETTSSSSQEFPFTAQAEQPGASPRPGAGIQRDASTQGGCPSAGDAQAAPPRPGKTAGADAVEEPGKDERARPTVAARPPPSSSPACGTSSLAVPSAGGARSPSPQFAPRRLTERPPPLASAQDSAPARLGDGGGDAMMANSSARKVPVRIIRAESHSEREARGHLTHGEAPEGPQAPPPPAGFCYLEPSASLFSVYTRQEQENGPHDDGPRPDDGPQPETRDVEVVPSSGATDAAAQRSEEDAKREELVRDIMDKDRSLVDILDQSGMKTTMDLMEGLFPQGEQLLGAAYQRRRASTGPRVAPASSRNTDKRAEGDSGGAVASLVPSSSYYSTSAPKAELLIKMKDMQEQLENDDSEDELDVDLASKKRELISSLAQKLSVLREARSSLQEDVEANEALGREVEATVQRLCRPNQLDKFRMFVGDLDKVVSLLLSLSGRLARVENALNSLEDEAPPEEKHTLREKRSLLMRQHDDARELKENLDRRERLVAVAMESSLDAESLADYRHFVKMKSALVIEQRKLEDKMKLGEEQLKCLVDSMPPDQRPPV